MCQASQRSSQAMNHPSTWQAYHKHHKVIKLTSVLFSILMSTLCIANASADTYTFSTVSGSGTPTLTTTVSGITLTATQGNGNNIVVSSGFLYPGTSLNGDTWTLTFDSPVSITQFDIAEFADSTQGDYVFTPDSGTAVSIADNDAQLSDFIATLTPSDWTSVSSVVMSFTGGSNNHAVGIDNIVFTAAVSNNAPTNISLSANTISQSATGAAAVIGSLTTTDTDGGDTHTYSLVTNGASGSGSCGAPGDDDNASFQVDNTNDDLETAASVTAGSYAVCVQTYDGTDSYQKTFSITVTAALSSSPTLTFTTNNTDITGDDIATDGEGGSTAIGDIDIQVFNISATDGTLHADLSWQDNTFLASSDGGYSGLTDANTGSKGMSIKSADGSEFKLDQFVYYNWGESASFTNTMVGYRDGVQVSSTTFDGFDSDYNPQTVVPGADFVNVDEVRFYISAGGYEGSQAYTNHSINGIQVSTPETNTAPALANLDSDSVAWAGVGNTVALDSGGDATGSDTELDALNGGSGDYSGASLTVQRSGGAVTSDVFDFDTSGALFTVSGSDLQSSGQTFATFTNANGLLTISFTSSATAATTALISDITQRIIYRNDTPAGDATIRFTLSDGTLSDTADVTVTTDTIYITNTSDTAAIDPADGVSFSEAIAIAAADGSGTQTLILASTLAGQTVSATSASSLTESLILDMDSASGVTLSGGALSLGGGVTLTLNNGSSDTASISTGFSGTGALAKTGDGSVTLTGTQTYSGLTTFTGGTVSVAGDSNLGSGQLVMNGGTLVVTSSGTINNTINLAADSTISHANDLTLSGMLSGSANLSKAGAGQMSPTNSNNEAGSSGGITITEGKFYISDDNFLPSGIITLNGGSFLASGSSGQSDTVDNDFVVGAAGGTFHIYGGGGNYTLTVSGAISGSGDLEKITTAALVLSGTNTYSGNFTISTGNVSITDGSNLGTGTVNLSGGTLAVTGSDVTISNNLVASSGTFNNANNVTWSGLVSGSGGLTKNGAGTLTLSGTQTHSGTTNITAGAVSISGDANIGSGTVTLNGGGLTVTGTGTIDNAISLGGSHGTVTNANAVALSGVISGTGNLTKTGAGNLTLSGINTYSGSTALSAGKLIVSGTVAGAVSIANTTTLEGAGSINGLVTVNSGGTLQIGASPGTMALGNGLTLNSGGTLVARLNGTAVGTAYDQYNVTGAVTLGGTLSVIGSYTPTGGESFVIISNDSTDAVSSTFNGLVEGDETTTLNAIPLAVSYLGSSGNDVTLDVVSPEVTAGNIAISGASGTGGAYKIGDTVSVSWDDTAGTGDNNGNITGVTVNFSAFGGGTAVVASNSSDTWTATYTLVAGAVDGTNLNVAITATNSDGLSKTTADTSNATVDNIAPTVTDGNISITGASGTGGAYIAGDIITATWNDTAAGDNNSDTISAVTVNFSAFGGGAAVAASNSSGTWTATYTIPAGAIDGTNLNIAVTATDNAGNTTTTADTSNATVDNIAPTVTDANISIAGATGAGGVFKVGDTITSTWNNTAGGDNNSDTISAVTVDFTALGGGAAVVASNSSDTWTATYTLISGAIDGSNLNIAVTATDNAGNATTAADTSNAAVDNTAPVVTDGNISITGASGTGGAFKVGDIITATWNNTAGGDNNSDTISAVTVNFSAFGGGAAVAASNSSETWTATYTITAGAIDGSNLNIAVTATDNVGNTTTTADSSNATVDNIAPTVTDGNLSITGASGTGGAYKAGDTLTATWNNTAGGDNNSDTISAVTVDFSAFGGGAAVVASNSSDTWTATYTIVAGAIDGSNLNISVTATDNAGNTTTTADTSNATVDNIAPTVTDGNISIAGASGTDGAYKVGDTITATWNNTAGGDNNSDTISAVTVNFSALGGGAAVAASNSSDTWTATYIVVAGAIDGTNLNIAVTATDNAGNATTTADTSNASLDSTALTVTDGNISITGASGTGGAFKVGDPITATWNNTAGGDNNSDTISAVTVDFTALGGGAAVVASNSSDTWTATYTITAGAIDGSNLNIVVTATDNAGNTTTTADTSNATVDNIAPTVTDGNISITGASGTGGAFKVGDIITATWNNTAAGDNNNDTISAVTVNFSAFGGGAAVAASNSSDTWTATYTIPTGAIDSSNLNIAVTATDNAGNATTTADTSNASLDSTALTVTDGNISIAGASGTGGAFKVGDTITATWNNTAAGDNNSDTVSAVTVNFSAFGGGAAVVASNSSDTWTATYTITAGAIDGSNLNIAVTATDNVGNITTTVDSSNATVDNIAPTVTDGNISITGASGTGGAFKVGDIITATWNNTVAGDNNSDTISAVTVDFTAFGGGAAVVASNSSDTWTATYTIVAGAIDGSNLNVAVTATDNAGNATTTADTSNATVDNIAPTVTDGNISITGASGTGGAFKVGDIITAIWNNTAAGDNNSDTISAVTVDFTALGGGAAIIASNSSDTWTATYTIVAGAIDGNNLNIAVTATDNAGNATTTADTSNASLDSTALTVTDGNIGITGASGTGGAYIVGDTITATWNNTVAGDNNSDTVSDVTVNFSAFGGGAAVVASNSSDTWTATYTIVAGAIDGTNLNIAVTATDNVGNITTTADTSNATVDNIAPTVTDSNISITGASGTGGAFKVGDTITATWNNTAAGDNNSDTISAVTVDFSAFGGGAAVAASNSSDTWTATYTLIAGAIDSSNLNVAVTATDNAGNTTSLADSSNASVDNQAPSGHSVSFDSGTINGAAASAVGFTFAGAEVGASYSYTISSDGGGTPVTGTGTLTTATDQITNIDVSALTDGTLTLSIVLTDPVGNDASAITATATLDQTALSGHSVSFDDVNLNAGDAAAIGFTFAAAEVGATYTYTISSDGGAAEVTGSGTFATATDQVSSVDVSGLSDGLLTLSVIATDGFGNIASAITASATLDQTAPTTAITSAASGLVNGAFSATVTFSEAVNGFVVGDIIPGNASLGGLTDNGGGSYSVTVTPTTDGPVSLDVAAAVAQDGVGNDNLIASQFTVTYDGTAPSLSASVPVDGATNVAFDSSVVLTFSEAVTAGSGAAMALYDAADDSLVESVSVTSGSTTISGSQVTVDLSNTLTPTHSYYVQIDSTAFTDDAGNPYAGIGDTTSLNFTVVNSLPVAANDSASVDEDQAVAIAVLANDSDADSSLNAASIQIVTAASGGSTSLNTGTGVITYTPTANSNGVDSFTYTVQDAYGAASNEATVSITINPVNDAPVAVNDLASTGEDSDVLIDVAANDSDIDVGDSVDSTTLAIVTAPVNGTAVIESGVIRYSPDLNYSGSDTFTYTIEDQNGGLSNVATAVINITGVNDLPVATDDTATVDEDSQIAFDVLANDSDIDGTIDATTVLIMTGPSRGQVQVDAFTGVLTYVPTADYFGSDSFTYVVKDDADGTSNLATVSLTVNSVNDAPVANDNTVSLQEDTPHLVNVLANDSDIDGTLDTTTVAIVTAAQSGSTTIDAVTGAITYTPSVDFFGSDSFSYRVQDNDGAWSQPATVTVTVLSVNDAPLANNDTATTEEDTVASFALLLNDSDVDGSLDPSSVVLVTLPSNGTLSDNGDGSVTYTPAADYAGGDSFTYTVADDQGDRSNEASVAITVTPINDAPLISGTAATSVDQNMAYSFSPTASDVDAGDTLTFSVSNLPAWASFNSATGALTGTPGNEHVGSYGGISISVDDGNLTATLPVFSVTVINTNDAPTIGGTPPDSVLQGGLYSFTPSASDADAGDSLTFSISNAPPWTSFDSATGALGGTPGNHHVGSYSGIIISVSDGAESAALPAFTLQVVNVNDAPVAVADSYAQNEGASLSVSVEQGLLANDTDIDGDALTVTVLSSPSQASNFAVADDGSFTYQHNGSETRSDSFTYSISDGFAASGPVTVSLTIAPVNDAPVFNSQPPVTTVVQGERFNYTVNVTDADSVASVSLLTAPAWLSFSNGQLAGTAPLTAVGSVDVTLRASDGEYTVDQSFALNLAPRELPVVTITPTWKVLPARVGEKIALRLRLEQSFGPSVSNGVLSVRLRGLSTTAAMANCSKAGDVFECPTSVSTSAPVVFTLETTPQAAGNLVAELRFINTATATTLASSITDVSVSTAPVSQSNVKFDLASAISIASIELIAGNNRKELVAGTSLGETVKLLDYDFASTAPVTVIGEIANRGTTVQVVAADVDQDGLADIVVINSDGDASAVYYDRGGVFETEPGSQTLPHAKAAILRDLDDDGLAELLLTNGGFNVYVYHNINGVFSEQPYILTSPAAVVHFALFKRTPADAPLGGNLVISSHEAVQVLRFGLQQTGNQGKPGAAANQTDTVGEPRQMAPTSGGELAIPNITAIRLVDLDGDGLEEVVLSSAHENASATYSGITVVQMDSEQALQSVVTFGDASAHKLEVADFNGDGQQDLLVGNDNGTYQFYIGNGTATSWQLKDVVIFENSPLTLAEDFDGDNLADVLVYRDEEEVVEIYTTAADGNVGAATDLALTTTLSAPSDNQYRVLYSAMVSNTGTQAEDAVTLTVDLQTGLTPVALPDQCSQDELQITCSLGELAPDAQQTVQFQLQSTRAATNATVTSRAFGSALDGNDVNNRASDSLEGLFTTTSVGIKGGGKSGGALSWYWLCLLAGFMAVKPGLRGRAVLLLAALLASGQGHSASDDESQGANRFNLDPFNWHNSYIEFSGGVATSNWSPDAFAVDLADATQDARLGKFDDQRGAWGLLGGYELKPWLAVEAGYRDWGHVEVQVDAFVSNPEALSQVIKNNYPVSGAGPYLGARLSHRSTNNEELFLKVGAWSWSGKYRVIVDTQEEQFKKSDVDILLGVGFNLFFSDNLGAGLLIERVSLLGQRQVSIGGGVVWRF